ncbi:PREDICTED: tripartite motif-containing protein 2-like [Amphimedon queenslandica]|nr:PREDICTED: tripartite motif-containing protein 2-like [Amphimedon queenslandica]|eukprot:XP_019857214.1 PREDICTED: tripartite motif-containing protein 2-like [Amphimedon queenslandica]
MENFFQLGKLQEQLTCAVCLDIYTNPRTLSCLHSYCEECLQGLTIYQPHSITCPNCRCSTKVPTPGGVTKFPPAFHLNGLRDIYNTLKRTSLSARNVTCDNCGSPNDIGYCRSCRGFLCPVCIDDHVGCSEFSSLQQSLASLGGGGLTSLNQLPENKDLCRQHSEPLETFCRTCNEVICLQCIVNDHSAHDTVNLVDGYFEDYPLLESSLNTIGQMIPSINHSLIDIDNQIEDVREQDEIIKAEIRLMVEDLTKALQKSARLLTADVEKITEARMARLLEQKKLAKSALKQTTHIKSYMDQCLQVGTIQQIALSKKQMMERMNALKDQIKLEEFIPIQYTAVK